MFGYTGSYGQPSLSPVEYDRATLYPHLSSTLPWVMFYATLFSGLLDNNGVELLRSNRVFNFECADDIALASENAQPIQRELDRLTIEVSRYGISLAPSKC